MLLLLAKIVIASPVILEVKNKVITVNGKKTTVATIEQSDGTWGYWGKVNESFDVIVKNKLAESTMIHWHGLILPNNQDGVSGLTNPDIKPGGEYHFKFPLVQSGTYWMHSHDGLQLQNMVVAPLIIESGNDNKNQQVVVMFQDYTKQPAHKILTGLHSNDGDATHDMDGMAGMQGMDMGDEMPMDLNDVKYDAYLTNYYDNTNPQITQVKAGSIVRLRFINAASASNFWINLGKLKGSLIALDGFPVQPLGGNKFQLAMGQRLDILVTIPKSGGSFPILGQVEGLTSQTGLVLTTEKRIKRFTIANNSGQAAPPLNYSQELKSHSVESREFSAGKLYKFKLSGDMKTYNWSINNQIWPDITPLKIKHGETVQFEFDNETMMSHPMHLHGYNFKIISINGKRVDGAIRDTILVMPHSKVTVEFVADYDGKWMLHCHTLYHMHRGMMTYIEVIPN